MRPVYDHAVIARKEVLALAADYLRKHPHGDKLAAREFRDRIDTVIADYGDARAQDAVCKFRIRCESE